MMVAIVMRKPATSCASARRGPHGRMGRHGEGQLMQLPSRSAALCVVGGLRRLAIVQGCRPTGGRPRQRRRPAVEVRNQTGSAVAMVAVELGTEVGGSVDPECVESGPRRRRTRRWPGAARASGSRGGQRGGGRRPAVLTRGRCAMTLKDLANS
jgi:hypothetical protein